MVLEQVIRRPGFHGLHRNFRGFRTRDKNDRSSLEIRQKIEPGSIVQIMVQNGDVKFFRAGDLPGLGHGTGGFAHVGKGLLFDVPKKSQTIHLVVIHQKYSCRV